MGECVIGMGQRSNYAAVKDVQIKLRKEECASSMEQRSNDAAVKWRSVHEAWGTGQKCARGMIVDTYQ